MKILAIDDEELSLEGLTDAIRKACPQADLHAFQSARDALRYASRDIPDIAFLDIEMRDMSGIETASELLKENPKMNILFATGYQEYMPDAFSLYASDYIMKPVTEQAVVRALSHLRYHAVPQPEQHSLQVQCFGSFEVFHAGKPLKFTRQKCKELFAYLIDRHGAVCSSDMIIGNLWPEDSATETRKSMVRTITAELAKTLRQADAEDVLIRMQGGISVDINRLDCDYYRFLNGDPLALHAFHGEYMTQYDFAEETRAALWQQLPSAD